WSSEGPQSVRHTARPPDFVPNRGTPARVRQRAAEAFDAAFLVDKHSGRAIRVTESLLSMHSLCPPEAAAAELPMRTQGWCVYPARQVTLSVVNGLFPVWGDPRGRRPRVCPRSRRTGLELEKIIIQGQDLLQPLQDTSMSASVISLNEMQARV
ncbi:MAG: hypothetical protein WDA71_10315, partial [Actinomycetota bacterium]